MSARLHSLPAAPTSSAPSAVEPPAVPASTACAQVVLSCVPLAMREIRSAMRQAAPEGLSVPQLRILLFARRQPDSSIGDLATHMGVTLPTASVTVSALSRRGLLAVVTAPADKRRRTVRLTIDGLAIVNAAYSRTQADFSRRLAGLSAAQLNQIGSALQTLSSCLSPP